MNTLKTCKLRPSLTTCRGCSDIAESCGQIPDCNDCAYQRNRYQIIQMGATIWGGYAIVLIDGSPEKVSLSMIYDIKEEPDNVENIANNISDNSTQPSCKLGDTVYVIDDNIDGIIVGEIVEIRQRKEPETVLKNAPVESTYYANTATLLNCYELEKFKDEDIGKTIFVGPDAKIKAQEKLKEIRGKSNA